jgi:phage gpG-like protein
MTVTALIDLDDDAVLAALAASRARTTHLKPALRSIARAGVASTRRRFQAGRGPDGAAWKKGNKTSGQTLILSGLLLRSISDRPPTDNSVEWGSNRIYAGVHQDGATIRAKNGKALRFAINGGFVTVQSVTIPARPYLGNNAEDYAAFSKILLRHVAGPLTGDTGGEVAS